MVLFSNILSWCKNMCPSLASDIIVGMVNISYALIPSCSQALGILSEGRRGFIAQERVKQNSNWLLTNRPAFIEHLLCIGHELD